VLGVVDHFFAVVLQIGDGLGDELQVFFFGDAERAGNGVQVPALAEDGDHGRAGFDQRLHTAVLFDRVAGEARGAEGGELGVLQIQFGLRAGEEVLVLGIGAGPAAFDIVDAQLVELLRDEEFVVDGERDGFALRAVAESGVESEDFLHAAAAAGWSGRFLRYSDSFSFSF
jgi:hypothetical protein